MIKQMCLSIIIVNYRNYELTIKCIKSVKASIKNINYEIIVIDNDSPNQSYEKILNEFKNIDKKIMHITRLCLRFSFVLLIFSIIILFTYSITNSAPILFYTGISIFTSSLYFIVISLICSLSFNKIRKELKL